MKLRNCFLCHGEAKLIRQSGLINNDHSRKWRKERVECRVCGLSTRNYKSFGSAVRSWNTRENVSDRYLVEALERITSMSKNDGPWDLLVYDMQQIAHSALNKVKEYERFDQQPL